MASARWLRRCVRAGWCLGPSNPPEPQLAFPSTHRWFAHRSPNTAQESPFRLAQWWSPQRISGRLKEAYPEAEEMWVSHETIYLSLFVQGRGALHHELAQCLRTRRAIRRPGLKRAPTGKGQIRQPVMISERPAEAENRAVPGHWEGDLLMGKRMTAIGTLVERATRYAMLSIYPTATPPKPSVPPWRRRSNGSPSTCGAR
jgi:IS30 family transposase